MGSLFDGYVVNQEITSLIKVYPDFVRLYKYKAPFMVARHDYSPKSPKREKKKIQRSEEEIQDYEKLSLRRAKTTLIDITLSNNFDLFVTFTFGGKDRTDIDLTKRKMGYWLNNQRILHGKFSYVIVAEYHKKKDALHFHGLFAGYNGNLEDSGRKKNGRTIFNITSYKGGWSTAVKIDHLEKVSSYVAKYITKEMPKFKGKQRYWCSNGLKRPLKIINPLLNEEDKTLFTSVFTDNHKEILEFRGQFEDKDILRLADYGKRREDDLWVASR